MQDNINKDKLLKKIKEYKENISVEYFNIIKKIIENDQEYYKDESYAKEFFRKKHSK